MPPHSGSNASILRRRIPIRRLYVLLSLVAAVLLLFGAVNSGANLLNEFQANPSGSDPATQDIELTGTPLAAQSGFLLSIDSDTSLGTSIG